MNDENLFWENLVPNLEQTQESFFNTWAFFEGKFNEFGTPGFSTEIHPARYPSIFGHNDEVYVNYTLYRGEEGQLLCVFGRYFDEVNNIEKPFYLGVHPDYQRQGIATMVANYVIAEIEEETQTKFDYKKSWQNIDLTLASANFANKYVRNNM